MDFMKRHSQTGRPPKAAERRTDTITFRVRGSLGDQLRKTAAKSERSLSDEIEDRLEQSFALEAKKDDRDKMHAEAKATLAEAKAALDAARIQGIRKAGAQIVREAGGKVTVNVSPELLLAEADGILRSGFVASEDVDKSPLEIVSEKTAERAVERIESLLVEAGLLRRKGAA
jgi:hypothetical protein